jgi:hypothetical protein
VFVPMTQPEHVASAGHVDIENPQRIVEIVLDADDCGQMEDRVDAGSQGFRERGQIGDIALHEPEAGMPVKVDTGVAGVLCEVEDRDGVSAVQQCGDQVRSDEAVATCHDDIGHESSFISWVYVRRSARLSANALVDKAGGAHRRWVEAVPSIEEHAPA